MNKEKNLLIFNYVGFGTAVTNLVAVIVILIWVYRSNEGLFFGMIFAFIFPALLVFSFIGVILYLALLIFNIRITIQSKKNRITSQQNKRIWVVFAGTTTAVLVFTVIFGLVSTPLVIIMVRTFSISNPFLTSPVRSVPTYPSTIEDNQSQYDQINETLFRSYNVPDSHPDEIAAWYKNKFSSPPWYIKQINDYAENDQYIGTIIYYCIQVQRDEGSDQKRTYFIEIFGKDSRSYSDSHVNIGTPSPITNVCEQFSNER